MSDLYRAAVNDRFDRELERIRGRLAGASIKVVDTSYLLSFFKLRCGFSRLSFSTRFNHFFARKIAELSETGPVTFPSETITELNAGERLRQHSTDLGENMVRPIGELNASRRYLTYVASMFPTEACISSETYDLFPAVSSAMKELASSPGVTNDHTVFHGGNSPLKGHQDHDALIVAKGLLTAISNPGKRVIVVTRDSDLRNMGDRLNNCDSPYSLRSLAERHNFPYRESLDAQFGIYYDKPSPIRRRRLMGALLAHHKDFKKYYKERDEAVA